MPLDPRPIGTHANSHNPGDKMICFDRSNPAVSQLGAGTGGRSRTTHRGTMETATLCISGT